MTNDQIRIAVAEACGWRFFKAETTDDLYTFQKTEYVGKYWKRFTAPEGFTYPHHCIQQLPNYPEDLNACHEMWKTLTQSQHKQFRTNLQGIVYSDGFTDDNPHRSVSNATALQRCEAFLRTLGLWKE